MGRQEKYDDVFFMKIIRPIITVLFKTLYTPKIIGTENIPKNDGIVLAGNHTSYFDCLLLISSVKRDIHFLAKDELWKGPKKIIFSNLGLIPVNRRKKDGKSLEFAKKYLENDKVIGIFPEGTIGKNGPLPFKIGAVKMAYDTKSKIVPFSITGKYRLFSRNLKIVFHEPINVIDSDLEKENENLRNIVMKDIGEK